MRARAARALVACVLVACAPLVQAQSQGFLRAKDGQIVGETGQPVLLRGVGLGGWMLQEGYMLEVPGEGTQHSIEARISDLIGEEKMRAFQQAWRDNHVTKADIDAMAAWGFNSVRLPMHYALFTAPIEDEPIAGKQTWREEGFQRTDALLSWVKANGMYLVLDLHAAPGGQGNDNNIADRDPSKPSLWDDPANQDKMVALWEKLAERYKDEPAIAAYDIINEPNWGFADRNDKHGCNETGNAPLRALLERTTRAIRAIDKRHMIVIEGNCWGNNYRGVLDAGLWDDNLVLSFHKYWNGTTRETIADQLALREKWKLPLWLGETGENSNDWFARTVATVEGEGIGWAAWPLKKIRYNNPLQVVPNPGYARVLAYWKGEGPKPSAAQAEDALMRLATHDIRFENNVQHPDVVDAWLLAPTRESGLPFKPHRVASAGTDIDALDFDMGRNGIAYFDTTAANESGKPNTDWNPSAAYRNDGMELTGDGVAMQVGEWVQYTVEVERAGPYRLQIVGDGTFRARVNGAIADAGDVTLFEGRNTLRIEALVAGTLQSLAVDPARD
jgi:hypothetical protein